jgi:hypothetical protein
MIVGFGLRGVAARHGTNAINTVNPRFRSTESVPLNPGFVCSFPPIGDGSARLANHRREIVE